VAKFGRALSPNSRDTYWSRLAAGSATDPCLAVVDCSEGTGGDLRSRAKELFARITGYVLGTPTAVDDGGHRFWAIQFLEPRESEARRGYLQFRRTIAAIVETSTEFQSKPVSDNKPCLLGEGSVADSGVASSGVAVGSFEGLVSLPYRKELAGALPIRWGSSKYDLARAAKAIDFLGMNLYVTWFGDTEFVEAITRRSIAPRLSILLPAPDSTQAKLHADKQAKYLKETSFLANYQDTVRCLTKHTLTDSVKLLDDIVIHLGMARFDDLMFVMPYLGFRRGSNGPVFIIERAESPKLFETFTNDFAKLWRAATPYSVDRSTGHGQ